MQIPNHISLNVEGQYCMHCFSQKVQRIFRDHLTFYHCQACGNTDERSLVIDNSIVWWVNQATNAYWHESVGVLVFNNKNQTLLFKRVIYPFAYAIPAGHLDVAENAQMAALRELKEEAGIELTSIKLFSEIDMSGDKCRRGADDHRWHLYVAKIGNNIPIIINEEGEKPVWLSLSGALKQELVYPVRYFIERYGEKLIESVN